MEDDAAAAAALLDGLEKSDAVGALVASTPPPPPAAVTAWAAPTLNAQSPLAAALLALAVTWAPEELRFLDQYYLAAYGAKGPEAIAKGGQSGSTVFRPLR